MMTFQQLQIGDYFRIPGITAECVYRKASSSHCSLNALLQPIRPATTVIPLSSAEITHYFVTKQQLLKSLKK
ncbi:hypothetical protein SAMD00079811_26890 [Scytonema sp. HK-05]|uniref:hypothetical protein n=1 Tax=Scytonema sp. HK-05 TaxID=1137095 RepID=UPI000937BCDE|nr:hypothetical protein NIES2130_01500 [Scytonema sp. HK-05]BAY45087.1 hypothetical protein SAMD00079811_26890 [Scytonema sp. HK-05]